MPDIFPRKNLPDEAIPWARAVEERIIQAENGVTSSEQQVYGLNRSSAATLETLADNIRTVQVGLERVTALQNALPIPYSRTSQVSDFGLSSDSWNSVVSVEFRPPRAGSFSISADAAGQLRSASTSTNMEANFRLVCNGSAGPALPGLYATPDGTWVNNFTATWGWSNVPVDTDSPAIVTLQVDPETSASWGTGTGSLAVLSGFAVFTSA